MELDRSEFERGGGSHPTRPPLRPLVGIPVPEGAQERGWRSFAVSVALHLLLVLLVIMPPIIASRVMDDVQGAGGEGPAGGGGGGTGGTGGLDRPIEERLRYIQVAPSPPAPSPTATQPETPVPPPVEEKKEQALVPPPVDIKTDAPKTNIDFALTPGTGGGTGNDGTTGSGPGTGGGVGSGVGTGRGSSTGPGTGGGPGTIYPPTPVETPLPPIPVPQRVRGITVVAIFEVDERGNVLEFTFTPTRDGDYNRRLREALATVRFRPGTRWDGAPVRAQAKVEYTLF